MKRLIFALLAALAVVTSVDAAGRQKGFFAVRYDLDATTMTYCTSVGANGTVWDKVGVAGDAQVDNTGLGTAITDTGTGHPFTNVALHDTIFIDVGGVLTPRQVITRTDADNIVVDEAIDLSATDYDFSYRDQTCGTASTSGWVRIDHLADVVILFNIPQYTGDGAGIDVRLEGAVVTPDGYTNPIQLWPRTKAVGAAATVQNLTVAGIQSNFAVYVDPVFEVVRWGFMHHTADDGVDTTTAAEQITITIVGTEKE